MIWMGPYWSVLYIHVTIFCCYKCVQQGIYRKFINKPKITNIIYISFDPNCKHRNILSAKTHYISWQLLHTSVITSCICKIQKNAMESLSPICLFLSFNYSHFLYWFCRFWAIYGRYTIFRSEFRVVQ